MITITSLHLDTLYIVLVIGGILLVSYFYLLPAKKGIGAKKKQQQKQKEKQIQQLNHYLQSKPKEEQPKPKPSKKNQIEMNLPPRPPSSQEENNAAVEMLLQYAKKEIDDGMDDPSNALSALLHAIRLTQGEDAIINVLDQAKQRAEQENPHMSDREKLQANHKMARALVANTSTLLYEQGNENILREAFEDGSSVICSACDSLVPRSRFNQHQLHWCEANASKNEDSDDN